MDTADRFMLVGMAVVFGLIIIGVALAFILG
jgi:hypothetical protein